MNNFLFFNYAKLKGYTFEIRESEALPGKSTFSNNSLERERIIFANYKNKLIGAVQINSASLPLAVYKEMGFKVMDATKTHETPLISYFFVNTEPGLRSDIVTTGLLLTLQEYAVQQGHNYCIGYAYECFNKELISNQMSMFEINHNSLVKCTHEVERLIKNSTKLRLNLDNPFIWNLKQPLVNFKLVKSSKRRAQQIGGMNHPVSVVA